MNPDEPLSWPLADPASSRAFYRRRLLHTATCLAFMAALTLMYQQVANAGTRSTDSSRSERIITAWLLYAGYHFFYWRCPVCRHHFGREFGWTRRQCDHCKVLFRS